MSFKFNPLTGQLDYYESTSGYVPYTGATADVDLGLFGLTTGGVTSLGGGSGNFSTTYASVTNSGGELYFDNITPNNSFLSIYTISSNFTYSDTIVGFSLLDAISGLTSIDYVNRTLYDDDGVTSVATWSSGSGVFNIISDCVVGAICSAGSFNCGGNSTLDSVESLSISTDSLYVNGRIDVTQNGINYNYLAAPTAPTVALAGVAGVVPIGTHYYRVTYVTADGETNMSNANSIVVASAANAQVNVTIPVSANPAVTARKIYRSVSSTGSALLATVANNTATLYVDNISAVGSNANWKSGVMGNTTAGSVYANNVQIAQLDSVGGLRFNNPYSSIRFPVSLNSGQLVFFNTADEENNVEYGGTRWLSNKFEIGTYTRGSGTARAACLVSATPSVRMAFELIRGGTDWASIIDSGTSIGGISFVRYNPTNWTAGSGVNKALTLGTTAINMSGTGGYSMFNIDVTETSAGSGIKNFQTYSRSGVTTHYITALGGAYFANSIGIGTSTLTGKVSILSTTEQLRLSYDASNYYKTTVSSAGAVTFDAVGSGSAFQFNDKVSVPRGGAATFAKVGGTIFDQFANSSVGGAEADIYTNTLDASLFATNGDKVTAQYGGNFVTVGTEITQLKVYLAGTAIWDSTGVAPTTGTTSWRVTVELIRVSSTVVRYTISLNTSGASGFVYCTVGELTGLTLTNTNILKITGTSSGVGSGAGDIIGKMGFAEFKPAI